MSNPEWIIAGCSLLGVVAFCFMTFQTKADSKASVAEVEKRHDALQEQVNRQDTTLLRVAQDTSYIRGKLDGNKKIT